MILGKMGKHSDYDQSEEEAEHNPSEGLEDLIESDELETLVELFVSIA